MEQNAIKPASVATLADYNNFSSIFDNIYMFSRYKITYSFSKLVTYKYSL